MKLSNSPNKKILDLTPPLLIIKKKKKNHMLSYVLIYIVHKTLSFIRFERANSR